MGEGIWKWRLQEYKKFRDHSITNELVIKTIQYLALKNRKTPFVLDYSKTVSENRDVIFNANSPTLNGTVTKEVVSAVTEFAAGKIEYRVDKTGNVSVPVGKASFEEDALTENVRTLIFELNRAKPAAAKGTYFKNVSLASTMGPGVKLDVLAELQV